MRPRPAYLVTRTHGAPLSAVDSILRLVRDVDPHAPVTSVVTGTELLRDSLRGPRYLAFLILIVAAVAIALSVVGAYGVMAYFVMDHRREIGLRLALGGAPRMVARMVVVSGMRFAIAGITVGLFGAAATTRFLASRLYGVTPTDPAVFASVAGGAALLAALACAIPAFGAARSDPTASLRL